MANEDLKEQILRALSEVAPELDVGVIDPAVNFRDQFEIDSVDFLSFVLALEKKLRLKVPELDYPKLSSLNGCVSYFSTQQERQPP